MFFAKMKVKIHKIDPSVEIPQFHTAGSVGFDLAASKMIEIPAGQIALIPTGLVIETPAGFALILASRSSVPRKFGITPPHGIGIIDQDYSGPEDEIKILVRNFTKTSVVIEKGARIAQGIFVKIERAEFEVTDFSKCRSRGGFGSTGHSVASFSPNS